MRITYQVHSCTAPSGGARIIAEHLNRLQARGHECKLATLDGSTDMSWFPQVDFQTIRRSQWEITAKRSDVVVATEANTMVPVMDVETSARKYLFCQMRESLFFATENPVWAGQVEENYRKAKSVLQPVVISRWLKAFLENEYGYRDVPIVPNGLNSEMFYPEPVFPKPGGKKRVLIEGFASSEAKDVDSMAYRATERYLAEHPGSIERWGFSQAPCYAEFDRYWRYPGQDLIRQIYSSSDVLLKATRFEGMSTVEVESWACGCPVVRAVETGRDCLLDGYNCLLSDYGDFGKFYEDFVKVLEDDNLRTRLRENGLSYVRNWLQWNPFIDRLERVYEGKVAPELLESPLPETVEEA